MRWFLRTAVAAAGLGSVAPVALAQPETPPPMMPPVRALPDAEPPAPSGFVNGLRGRTAPAPAPDPAVVPAGPLIPAASPVSGAAAWVPAASPAKPAPPVLVQNAIPTNATATAVPAGGTTTDEPPMARPDRLPATLPAAPAKPPAKPAALPAPSAGGPLPPVSIAPIPVAPAPGSAAPRAPGKAGPQSPAKLTANGFPLPPAGSAANPAPLPPALAKTGPSLPVPPAPKVGAPAPGAPPAAAVAASAACAGAAAPCPTARVSELVCDPVWRLCPQDAPVRVRGWLDGGYVYNTSNPASKFNGPYNSIDRANELMGNQAYLIVDHPLPTNGSFGAGFRVDALYGYDYFLGQSRGFEADRDGNPRWNGQNYGVVIPQAYAEVGNDFVSLKLGHFYSPVGYEMLPAVANFFYSHAYSYQFGQPITHWGGLLTTQLTRNWQVQAGLVNGWDTLVGRVNNVNFIGGLRYTPDRGGWWSSFTVVTGQEQNNPAGLPFIPGTDGNRTRYSFLFGVTPGGPGGRWEYVFHHYYGWQENGTPQLNFARWYGIDQYLYYRVSRTVRLGTRFEWFRDEDGTRVGLNRPANPNNPPLPGNYFALTAGLNYTPVPNFVVRPEVRWDFTSDTARPAFSDGKKNNQLLVGMDLIWQF